MTFFLPFFDPRAHGWAIDTSVWRNALCCGDLPLALMRGFGKRLYLPEEVIEEVPLPANPVINAAAVFTKTVLSTAELADWRQLLRQRFGSADYSRHRGEAACIAISTTRDLALVLDDRVAIEVATERKIPVMRTTNLLVAAVQAEWMTAAEAWVGFQAMVAAGRTKLGPELWGQNDEPGFLAVCRTTTFSPFR